MGFFRGPEKNGQKSLGNWGYNTTVDGRNPAPVEVGSLSHYLQGFVHILING